ncbi:MAG: hypothetical protein N3C59_06730 [Azovibrio sp.]|nr:hypothetical protein [Azovibrio sp.]
MMYAALYGWLVQGPLVAACAALLARPWAPRLTGRLALSAGALTYVPLPEIGSLAAWLHGVLGVPSMTLLQFALLVCLRRPLPPSPGPRTGCVLLALALTVLAAALGLGPIDPYGWGFQARYLLLALLPVLFLLYRHGQGGWLMLLAVDLLAYTSGLYANLWDALYDPILVFILALHLVRRKPSA